jgi:DNA-binding winged helix-turn-helix (wHTH) protein
MYILEDEYFYDETTDFIWSRLTEAEKIQLPFTASRLLQLLLVNKGKVMSRENIFDEIWKDYGLNLSNNTLNQYISLLRKRAEQLGLTKELIKTIPKAGFLVPDDIKINLIINDRIQIVQRTTKPKMKFIYLGVFILFLGICYNYYATSKNKTHLVKLGTINNCPIFMLYSNSLESNALKLKNAKDMIDAYAPCLGHNIYIYHPSDSFILTGKGPVFISRCTYQKNSTSKFAGCYDVYKY